MSQVRIEGTARYQGLVKLFKIWTSICRVETSPTILVKSSNHCKLTLVALFGNAMRYSTYGLTRLSVPFQKVGALHSWFSVTYR